jgi:hypothetical protein
MELHNLLLFRPITTSCYHQKIECQAKKRKKRDASQQVRKKLMICSDAQILLIGQRTDS